EIVAINEELEDSPELVNSDAFGEGWLFRVKASDESELAALLDAAGYAESIED
ncbi:glycine cleavage system protein H, partial [Colwellia marinimaniae]